MSPTGRSRAARKTRMSRRRTSAMALKTSVVVAARGTPAHHIPIWEYVNCIRNKVGISARPERVRLLQQQWLGVVLDARRQAAIAYDQARARVPAQDRVVVAAGTKRLGALVPVHRLAEPVVDEWTRAGRMMLQLRLRPALVDEAGVVGAFVLVPQLRDRFPRSRDAGPRILIELLGQGQQQRRQRRLIVRLDGERVQADALRFARLVQQTVALGLGERAGHRVLRQHLQLELHGDLRGIRTTTGGCWRTRAEAWRLDRRADR